MRKPSNDIDGKNKSACPKGKRKLEYADNKQPKLPLTGKLIYLDVKDVRLTKKLETDLKRLGSSVEKFFVKEINYLITSHPRPKQKNEEKFQSADSPAGVSTPSPFNCGPSPSPGAVETKAPQSVTRGKAILQKAQLQKKTSSIIENAEKWKVKIVSVEAALKWIVKELAKLPPTESAKINQSANARSCKVKRLRSPMLKFESSTRQYRPVHGSLDSWPYANVDTPKGTCPFDGTTVGRGERSREERGDRIGLAQQMENNMPASPAGIGGEDSGSNKTPKVDTLGKSRPSENQGGCFSGTKTVTAGEMRRRKEQKRLQERKRGYCECCQIKYDDLDKHVYQDQHKAFIRDKKNYETLDNLIVTGRSTAHFLQRVLLRHCTKKNLADDKSESEEEVMLITPGKSAAKTKAGEKKILQGKSPSKGRQPQVRIGCSVQESKELKKNPRDSKPEAQRLRGNMKDSKPVSERLGENSGESKKVSERLRGNSGDSKPVAERLRGNSGDVKPVSDRLTPSTSKNDNSDAIDLKHTDIEVQKKDSVNQKDSKLKVSSPAILNTAKMKDCSPDKRSCTSEGLDMKNHVVPVRTRNSLGVYPNMSPSHVSWARRQSMSGDEDSLIGSDKPSKASCVRTLDSSRQVDTAVENKSQENQRNKHNKKLSDRENKIDSPLPGDRIRVLRESRTRSKQTSPCSQHPESSPKTQESVHKILQEAVKDNADEVDGDVPYKPTRKVSIVEETRIVSPSRHKRLNAKVVDVEQSPRRQRQCRSQTKAVEEVEGESIHNISNKGGQLDSCLVKDSNTVKTRNRSPVKSTHSHSNTKVDLHETKDSPSTRIRHLSPEKDRISKSKNKLESTTTRTIDSPVTDTKSLRKTDLQHSQVKDVRSPRSRSHSLGKVSKVESTHVNVSVTTRTRSQSPTRNVHCHSEAEEIDETTTPRRKKRSCVKDAARGSAAENQTTGENDEDKGSVQVDLNSPRLRRKLVVGQSEEKIEEKFEKCKNMINSTEKCTKNQLVNDEPLSPRKRMRSRESNSTKDSQIGKTNAVNSVIKEDITSGKIVPKRNTVSESPKSSQNREKRSDILHAEKNFKSPVDLNEERKSPYVDPVVSSALMINSMEEGFYVNCMEMVKKRSQMRQAAQKLKNADNPLGSGSIVASRLDGTPRKKITVTVSPVKSDKSVHQRPKISASIIQRENRSIIKTHSNSPANTQSAISSNDRKNNTNLVKISLGKSDRNSRVHVRKEEDLSSQGSASSKTHPDSRRHHRTRNESRENEDTGRSPSPLFNRSPKYNKSRKSMMDKHRRKSHSRGRKNAECDPYDIENLSPLKPGENVIKSPRSGYSGETLRSKKKNRNWRPQQKQLLQGKSSSSKKLQKLKLPDPTQEIKPQEDENTESNSACENQSHRNKNNTNITENVSQHLHKPSEKDKHSCSRRQSARQKLELDDLRGETVCSVASENTQRLAGSLDKTGGDNSKKLESRDLVLKDGETVSCGDQYSQRKRNVMSPKHRKRKNSHSDSGVGFSKDRIKKGHDRKNSDSTLKWQTAVEPSSPKAKTVKLNKSWTLLSDRSMAKILQSEEEDVPFEGFQPEHATGASLLGSEVSYVETTEVELDGNSNHEWQLDNDEGVDEEDTSNENEFNKYANLNDTFTSPGKRTDSSWDETFDNYIDIQLNRSKPKEANVSTTFNDVHSSPRIFNSPRRQRNLQRGLTPNKRKAEVADLSDLPPEFLGFNCTPKRRKFQRSNLVGGAEVASVEAIDEDIEFNYCSPQKLKELRKPAGAEVVISSSPVTCRSDLFTSTPHASRQNMKMSRYNSLDLPALSDHEPQTLSESDNLAKAKSGKEGHKTKMSSSQNDSDKQTNKSRKHRHKSRSRHENKH
ncbi:uro-adherence factor A-like [Argopecten irradians]|uniref:uro-adherence factor A-like n=1 Tax=Argopecten irradians TaxID=31199 RepID=UPI003711DF69